MTMSIRGARVLGALAVALLPALRAPAAGALSDPLRLADLLAVARENNPQILAARGVARAAAYVPARVRAWDDPVLSWEAWNTPENFNVARAENTIFRVAQRIPFPGKRPLAAASAAQEARALGHDADAVALDVEAAVKRAYWSLWRAHERVAVLERQRILAERIERMTLQRYVTGGVSQSDVLRAQVELAHAVTETKTAALAIDQARADLHALLSRPPGELLGRPEAPALPAPPADLSDLTATALARRPELAAQGATIAGQERVLAAARRAYLPDFELSVGRFINAGASDGFGAMATVTVPIANAPKYDAGVAEASARVASAGAERRRIEDSIRREVEQAWLRLRTAALEHDLNAGTHIPHAALALESTEGAYAAGSVDLLALLDALRALQAVHLEHVDSAAEIATAWADLERAVGGPVGEESHHD